MYSSGSGEKLEKFFNGKGFYIVLFLCAAVIGASAWMMAAGDRTMTEEISVMATQEPERVETVILPPQEQEIVPAEVLLPEEDEVQPVLATPAPTPVPVWNESVPLSTVYLWPVSGVVSRPHNTETLAYDVTMRDWRTHGGVDIEAALGTAVTAAHAGMVESVVNDDLYGTVVTVDHGDGCRSVYANLAPELDVGVGSWVEPGSAIGCIGESALCEIGQAAHLHFAVTVDGVSVDPLAYLPA